jgi:hypothetical protein
MLDNGIFEGEILAAEDYSRVVNRIRPKILIAQDIINDDVNFNYDRAETFATNIEQALAATVDVTVKEYHPEIMCVMQKASFNSLEDVSKVLQRFCDNPKLKWIGLCRDFAYQCFGAYTHTDDQELNRFVLGTWLQQQGWIEKFRTAGKKIHFLGIGDKVFLLQYAWYVDSADTASFLWQASFGSTLGNMGILYTKYKRPYNYFEMTFGAHDQKLWAAVSQNCYEAQRYAQMADDLRRQLHGGRI